MTTKEKLVRALNDLPDDVSYEDAIERLVFLAKIEQGLAQADAGQTVSHTEVKQRMSKWVK